MEVSEEVLRRGGSVAGLTTLGSGGLGIKGMGVNPPPAAIEAIQVTTCRA
ncbi:UNVERIFIED_CONTAM: hypothetical protein Sradi_1302400 [Sesamum radiatum]|uniref:Uncharacterized protein n=1 Tax=Sesamum radiatum TaxID=300843 RepID=A0AAW2UPC3_SESRA